MRKKYSYIVFVIILLLPLINLFDNQLIANTSQNPDNSVVIMPSAINDFSVKLHVGDMFQNPYESYVFNPNDNILITGSVKNDKYPGTPTIKLALWLVDSKQPSQIKTHIINITSTLQKLTSKTFKQLNSNTDVVWNVGNFKAGTYRLMAQIFVGGVARSTPVISGKAIVIRQIQMADFSINSTNFNVVAQYSIPGVSSYGLTYYAGFLYMTDRLNNDILKIDPSDGSIDATISITGYNGQPYGITTDSKSGFYIAYRDNDEYVRVTFAGAFNFKANSTLIHPMALTMLGSYLGITHDSSNKIYKIAPFTGLIQDSWTVAGNFLYGLTVAYDQIWYSDFQNDAIRGIDYTTHVQKYLLKTGEWGGLAFDGTYLWAWDNTAKKLIQFHPLQYKFSYKIQNTGNCDISGVFKTEIQKLLPNRGVEPSPFNWAPFDIIDSCTHTPGSQVIIPKGQPLNGQAVWGPDTSPSSGVYRLYIGLLDTKNNLLYNLNDSVPIEHPRQGGMFIDSDKIPRLVITRNITRPTSYFVKQELNVTLYARVIGVNPVNIGIFNVSTNVLLGISNLNFEEDLNDKVLPPPKGGAWVSINDGPKEAPWGSSDKYIFNRTHFSQSQFRLMTVGEQLKIKYNIAANFTPEINRPTLPGERRVNVGFREELTSGLHHYESVQIGAIQNGLHIKDEIDPELFTSHIGVIVYMGRLFDLYDAIESLTLIFKLAIWVNDLPAFFDGMVYFVDDDLSTNNMLNFMGLTVAQKATYNGLDVIDRAHWLFGHVDEQLIAQAIDACIAAEAEANDWDIIMLVGGVNVIPMRIVDNPSYPALGNDPQETDPSVATDFYYGDLTPEANLDVDGWIPELVVSRLAGRNPVEMMNLLDAADLTTPTSGNCGIVSYFKGEDSMRRLEDIWGAVKPADTYYETENQFTLANIRKLFNPGHATYGGAANYPFAMLIYNDHGWVNAFSLQQADVQGFTDYVDGARPFVVLRCCESGYLGDPGDICDADENGVINHYTEADSITLDLLEKGVTGVLGSTRISSSPYGAEWGNAVETHTQPVGAPASVSGDYQITQVNVGGVVRDAFAVDTNFGHAYNQVGIDFNGDGDFDANEIYDNGEFFEDPTNPAGTWDWRYQMGSYCWFDDANGPGIGDWVIWYANNDAEDWNDVFLSYFVGEEGFGIMQGANVGAAFQNAKTRYWAYMQTGVHAGDAVAEALDRTLLLEYNLYGVPIYKPDMQDPPINATYTADFTPVNDWGFNATFEIQNYTKTEVRPDTYLFQIEGAGLTGGQNQPRLPMIMENITIPEGFSVDDIQIVSSVSTVLPGSYNIVLSQPRDPVVGLGDDFYFNYTITRPSLSGIYPNKLYDYTAVKQNDGSTTLFIAFFPFQWIASSKTIVYYSNVTLHFAITDTLEDSVSLAITKSASTKTVGRGSNFQLSFSIINNGSNPVYNINMAEYIEGVLQDNTTISMLSSSGLNASTVRGFLVSGPAKYFSGWFETTTIVTFQDSAGTPYSLVITKSVYLETWLGLIIIILCLIVALAVTIIIMTSRG